MLFLFLVLFFGGIFGIILLKNPWSVLAIILGILLAPGFIMVEPNGSRVLLLFGEYIGTVKKNGFFWVNPFYTKKKISLRASNFDSERLKVNDKLGNPVMISTILVWRVENTYKAAFDVDNYENFVRVQTDAAVRKLASMYPYDNFADEGYDAIVTVGFGMGEATIAAANKYPDVDFIGVDQFQAWEYDGDDSTNVANLAGLNFPEDNAGFLVGALAAMMTESGKIGSVLGTDAVPPVWRYGEGYRAGAAYINPDVEVFVVYHNDVGFDKTFTDPEWGAATANSMIDQGADVIFGAGGKTGNGAVTAAAQRGVYAVGVDADAGDVVAAVVLRERDRRAETDRRACE